MGEMTVTAEKKGITGLTLKIIAIVAMFIDHFAAILISDYLNMVVPYFPNREAQQAWSAAHPDVVAIDAIMGVMRLIGRFGFPLFAFLIVEGFQHTRSVKKYALNLGIFALISELPFNLGFSSRLLCPTYQNVFFTLLLGLLCLASVHYLCETKKEEEKFRPLFYVAAFLAGPYAVWMFLKDCWLGYGFFQLERNVFLLVVIVAAVVTLLLFVILGRKWDTAKRNEFTFTLLPLAFFCLMGDLLLTDYGAGGVLTIAIMYFFRKKRLKAFALGCVVLTLLSPAEVTAFLMLIPLAKYNGERGRKINKYFFYAFYPVHIGLIYLLTLLIGFTTFAIR